MGSTDINNLKSVIMNRISEKVTTVQDVSDYEKTGFKGFPAVTVVCSGNENDYWSTAENQRQFTFIVRVYEQLEQVPAVDAVSDNAKQRAEAIIGRVVSEIIDTFDEFFTFNNEADYCRAVPSSWGYVKLGEGWCRTAEIKLQVVKSYTVQ